MFKREHMDQEHHMIVVIVEKESMESSNLDHMLIKKYLKDKRLSQDHMEESCVLDVLNPESLELSFWKKSKLLKGLRELPRNDVVYLNPYLRIFL